MVTVVWSYWVSRETGGLLADEYLDCGSMATHGQSSFIPSKQTHL